MYAQNELVLGWYYCLIRNAVSAVGFMSSLITSNE